MKHAIKLKEVFINLAAVSSWPAITTMDITNWCTNTKIAEGALNATEIDRYFIAANFVPSDAPKFRTMGNALVRYDFWELLVRISNAKYRETGICKSYSEALEKMITERILPY